MIWNNLINKPYLTEVNRNDEMLWLGMDHLDIKNVSLNGDLYCFKDNEITFDSTK